MKTAYLVVAIFAICIMTYVRSDSATPAADAKKPAATVAPVTAAPAGVVRTVPEGWRSGWNDDWAWRGRWGGVPVADWNRDGVVDWRDTASWGWGAPAWGAQTWAAPAWGAQTWGTPAWGWEAPVWGARSGDVVRADWNHDGVIDARDGWRRLGEWNGGAWDPSWRGNGWRQDTVAVREVPTGTQWKDSDWFSVEGFETPVWGAQTWAAPAWTAPTWTAPTWGWEAPVHGWQEPVRVREVPAGWTAPTTTTTKPVAAK